MDKLSEENNIDTYGDLDMGMIPSEADPSWLVIRVVVNGFSTTYLLCQTCCRPVLMARSLSLSCCSLSVALLLYTYDYNVPSCYALRTSK